MKGNNIHFAKSAVWGVFKCIFRCIQSTGRILGGSGTRAERKPDDRVPG